MIRYRVWAMTGCLMVSAFLALTGCVKYNSPTVNYFNLLTMEQLGVSKVIAAYPDINLGVGPVSIPDSLKRSQIATSQSGSQYEFDEYNRWAGMLDKDFTTVVGENLGVLLGVKNLGYFPWMPYFKPTYQLIIDIQRLDGALDDEAVLIARWSVVNTQGKELVASGRNVFRQPVKGDDFAALVKAESLLVAELSTKVAKEIQSLIAKQAT
jgi:uncharacterized protein